jgi:LPXTG-motif cell wall-anchored protein
LSDNKVNKSLPKTGSAFDTSILLIAASLIMALGLVFRKLNRA